METKKTPHIHILAMGGTIAGRAAHADETVDYRAGAVGIEELVSAVPQLSDIADITGETVASIDSKDLSEELMLCLAQKADTCLADSSIDGLVITHGTDTLEESAFFLSLTVSSDKPIVFTGAMRPSTALSADGPLNLLNAVRIAASADARGRGVLITLNDSIDGAADVTKMHTARVDTFRSPNAGPLGTVDGGSVHFFQKKSPIYSTITSIKDIDVLPSAEILYGHAGESRFLVDALIRNNIRGIVYAGTGMGSISEAALPALREAQEKGIIVVRASRTGSGSVLSTAQYPLPFVTAGTLVPQKALFLLQILLTKTNNPSEIQDVFNTY